MERVHALNIYENNKGNMDSKQFLMLLIIKGLQILRQCLSSCFKINVYNQHVKFIIIEVPILRFS